MKKGTAIILASFAAGLLCCHAAPAGKFTVNKLFSPHMVLQREKPVKIFGTADPGDSVKVTLAGKTVTATANTSGQWLAEFPAMKAGTGYTLEVAGGNPQKKVILKDVAVGEVWLCSGQSNMQMPVLTRSPIWRAANAEEEAKNANWPEIREFHVTRNWSPGRELDYLKGTRWAVCNPQNVRTFSAYGYFFARQLYKDLQVPIGIIHSSFGGTNIMAWMPRESFVPAGQEAVKNKIEKAVKALANRTPEEFKRDFDKNYIPWINKFNAAAPDKSKAAAAWKNPDFDDSNWQTWTPDKVNSAKKPHVVWYRNTYSSIPASYAGGAAILCVPAFVGTAEVYLNGKLAGRTDVLKPLHSIHKNYSFKLPDGMVVSGKNVVAVRISDYGLGITKFNDVNYTRIAQGRSGRTFDAKRWKMKTEYTADTDKIGKCPELYDSGITTWGYPGTLFNGMIAPLTQYPIRGVLWYQGESDAYFSGAYYPKHRELIKSWRQRWNSPHMPFIVTQLAGIENHTPMKRLPDGFWKQYSPAKAAGVAANLREVQGEIGKLPNVGLVTAIDVGDHSDVHPRDKQTIGFRAAKEAERFVYGKKIVSRGPAFKTMKIEGDKIRIYFDNIGGGLATKDGKAPNVFAIAGKDGKFVWADAVIDGNTVVVSSPEVPAPANVQYAWVKFRPDLNLVNKAGFPAFPFRTDAPEYK